jgi:hypothetical protein
MNLTIKSKRLRRDFDFFAPPGGGYVRLERGNRHGTLGDQICDGGHFMGNTLRASEESFERVCRRWYRAHLRRATQYGGLYEFEYEEAA